MSDYDDDDYGYGYDSAVEYDDYGEDYGYDYDCDYGYDEDGATESVSNHIIDDNEGYPLFSFHDDPYDSDEEYFTFDPNPNPTPKHYPTPTITVASDLASIGEYDDAIAWNHVLFNVLGFTTTHHQNILELFSKHGINDITSLLMLQQHELFSMSQEMRKVEHFICYAEALFGPEECIFASPRQWLAITANFFMEDCRQQYQLSCPILHRFCERKKKTCLDPDYIDTFNIYPHEQVDCVVDNIMASSVDPYKKNSLVCLEPYKKNALISVDPNMVDPLLSFASFMVDPLISVDSFKVDPLVESDKGESPNEIILFLPIQSDAPKVQSVKCTGEVHCSDLHTPDPILESSFVPYECFGKENQDYRSEELKIILFLKNQSAFKVLLQGMIPRIGTKGSRKFITIQSYKPTFIPISLAHR
jgi:hypothetical protein